jgi:hypothetical protein
MLACTSLGGLWSAGRRTPVSVAVVVDCLQVDGFLSEEHRHFQLGVDQSNCAAHRALDRLAGAEGQ